MKIVTHDGGFHTDEVVAIALLKKFVVPQATEVIRTRDDFKLKQYTVDKTVFVVDVGRQFEEKNKNFDHHQRTFNEKWEDGIGLSSCGLVWRYIRKKGFLKKYNRKSLANIEERIIKKIDLHDNGFRNWPLATMFSLCNREDNTMSDFNKALDIAKTFIDNIFYQELMNEKNEKIFEQDLKNHDGGEIFHSQLSIKNGLLLKKLANETRSLVVLYKNQEHEDEIKWCVKSLNRYEDDVDEPIGALAPEELRGLSNYKLINRSKIKGAVFVHRAGFMCVCKSKKSALQMADLMIETYHETYGYLD